MATRAISLPAPTQLEHELLRAALGVAGGRAAQRLLYISDLPMPAELRAGKVRRKIVYVVSTALQRDAIDRAGEDVVMVPPYDMGRQDKFKLALIAAAARGYVEPGDRVVGVVGRRPDAFPDTMLVLEVEEGAMEPTLFGEIGGGQVAPAVFDAVIELAVQLGVEGWEGHALGTMFVLGDVDRVMASSRQLALNPFQGYSDEERNLIDPEVREALRNFATLEGAFVVREDGVVLAAGRYLQAAPDTDVRLPLGLGARHMAGAMVSAATDAVVVVVSQSTGKVRVYRRGATVLELSPSHRRI